MRSFYSANGLFQYISYICNPIFVVIYTQLISMFFTNKGAIVKN